MALRRGAGKALISALELVMIMPLIVGIFTGNNNRVRRSRARFAGARERGLARVRHLCRACHARLHRLRAIDRWVPDLLETLWAEQHPGQPRQLQLPATR